MSESRQCKQCGGAVKPYFDRSRGAYRTKPLCERCRYAKQVRQHDPLAAVEVTVDAPPPTPLETAEAARRVERERRDLKSEHRALLEENERLRGLLTEAAKLEAPHTPSPLVRQSTTRGEAIACAMASDWHVEESVDAAPVHGLNEYSLEIARARSRMFFQSLLTLTDICARDSVIDTINLDVLGDMFTGFLHDENLHSNQLAPGDAARFVRDLFFDGIDFLLRESSYVIEGDMIPGNHGRMTKFVWSTDPTGTSLETLAYHSIVDRYRDNPRVKLRVAGQAMVYARFFERFTVRKIHGYEIKYGGGIGGITIPVRKAIAAWDKSIRADLTIFGHFHQRIDGGDFLANGSLIGFNAYAQSIKASFEQPQQSFYLIDARNGGEKSITAPIWVEPPKAVKP